MDERESFWDIEKLIPKTKKASPSFVTKPVVNEVNISFEEDGKREEQSLGLDAFRGINTENAVNYTPNAALLKSVTVSPIIEKFDFYANFKKAALIFFDMTAQKCDFEKYFSYMPQYSQLTAKQRSYYLYWRSEFRRGNAVKTDYSYFYLLVYEILNLPDKIPPEKGLGLLISLWRAYREELPNINSQMALWIEDYCLVHALALPIDKMSDFLHEAISASGFREFYITGADSLTRESCEALISSLSYYDWRHGKFAGGESRAEYKRHLLGAMRLLFVELWKNESFVSKNSKTEFITRQSFKGALCTQGIKNILRIEYHPLLKDDELRNTVTEALRYTENQLRALLGVKSRLAVKCLSEDYKKIIDFYFSEVFLKTKNVFKTSRKPEYEKLYDSLDNELSLNGADEIENLSWLNTKLLVSEEKLSAEVLRENTASEQSLITDSAYQYFPGESSNNGESSITAADMDFIKALLNGDSVKIKNICVALGELPESIAERINEAALSEIGDVIIEFSDAEAALVEDYREEIFEWIERITK